MKSPNLHQTFLFQKMMIPFCFIMLFIGGCRQPVFHRQSPQEAEGKYFDELANFNRSFQLEDLSKSVKKLFSIVEYDIYHFDESDGLSPVMLNDLNLRRVAGDRTSFSETVFGTATILQSNSNGMLLITCAHIVSNPDTIVTFYTGSHNTRVIESIAIKKTEMTFVRDVPGNNLVKVLAKDLNRDIAFMSGRFTAPNMSLPQIEIPVGNVHELSWTTPVYLMGFPGGQQMVTRAIIGNPMPSNSGDFVVDATFNPGGSGSLALALNNETQGFELVGLIKATAANYRNVLKPEMDSRQELYNPNVPYSGTIYAEKVREIYHGVTYGVSINSIRDFYIENRRTVTREGFNLDSFFGLK
jgi:hypothetical protein